MTIFFLFHPLRLCCELARKAGRARTVVRVQIAFSFVIALLSGGPAAAQNAYVQRNLVSDLPGVAANTDTNLVNPWGIAFNPTGPFWIADNHSGLSTLYDGSGIPQALVVNIPSPGGLSPAGAPTGLIF